MKITNNVEILISIKVLNVFNCFILYSNLTESCMKKFQSQARNVKFHIESDFSAEMAKMSKIVSKMCDGYLFNRTKNLMYKKKSETKPLFCYIKLYFTYKYICRSLWE